MIHAIRANDSRFRAVSLGPGLNVLLADTTEESSTTDTRNGLGKTLLLEILHFCLGSSPPKDDGLASPALTGWSFTVDLTLAGKRVEVTRRLSDSQRVSIAGDFAGWTMEPKWNEESAAFEIAVSDWKLVLGEAMFGLDLAVRSQAHCPTFRSVFPYFARVHSGAYASPFKFFSNQPEVVKQVSVAFLLDLAWEDAARFQHLKDQRAALKSLKTAIESGALGEMATLGELRAQRVGLQSGITVKEAELRDFEVHPEYGEITAEANRLTQAIHDLVNVQVIRKRTVESYEMRRETDQGPKADEVVALFAEAGVELSGAVRRTLAEAESFHDRITSERLNFLSEEIDALRNAEDETEREIETLSISRAQLLQILESKHALDELNQLQERLSKERSALAAIDAQIARITEVEEREAAIRIELDQLGKSSRREHAAREPRWTTAIELFAANTLALYGASGELVIDLDDTGFHFNVKIRGGGSRGIDNMKIFAFDLMLAELWAARDVGSGILFHDSELFDGVDERQIAVALRLAEERAVAQGFQYFCSMNTDDLPSQDLLGELCIEPVLRLTDATDDGGLFGMRF